MSTFTIEEGAIITSNSRTYRVIKVSQVDDDTATLAVCKVQETGEILTLKCIQRKLFSKYKQEATVFYYLKDRNPDENNLIKFTEIFGFHDWFCIGLEKLDMRLSDFMISRNFKPLEVHEIRLIAKQLLLALNHLHSVSLAHLNLRAEDISLVDHKSQPFKVKLSGFGFAGKISKLSKMEIPKTLGYCAPEVLLDCPLNQSVDIWSLGSLLASLFVGRPLFPTECAYGYLKIITKLFGQPDQSLLEQGRAVQQYFTQSSGWMFKTAEEYTRDTGTKIQESQPNYYHIESLDDLVKQAAKTEDNIEFKDTSAFVDLLKKMLTLNPEDRISPADALNHRFITMEHVPVSNASETHEIPAVSQITGQDVKIHESDLDVADSCKNPEPSMLELEKGVKIINQSDVYQIEDVLGSKGSTQLVTCRKEGTNDTVKVKIFRKEKHWQAEMEINVYNHLNDLDSGKTNLIRLIVSFTYKDCICLVFKLSYPRVSDSPEKQDPKPASVAENASTDVSEGPFTHPGSATEGENHKSGLNLTESSEEIQSSTLEVGKGVKIIDQLNVYIIERLRGSGTFGKVFKCKKEQTGEIVAVKVFNKYERYFADLELKAYNELSVLEADKNNFIRVFDSFIYKNHTCLVLEHLDVNLFQLVLRRRPRHLSVAEIRPIAEQLLVSLRALKSIGLTHTDIKPDNIMLVHSDSKPFKIKLIDFGLAVKTANLSSTSWMQPKGYRAPEVFLGLPRDEGIDMWGLGCVLVFLFVANHMFPLDDYRAMRQIVRLMGLPVNSMLENGAHANRFFIQEEKKQKGQHIRQLLKLGKGKPKLIWRLKTKTEYEQDTERRACKADNVKRRLKSLDDLLIMAPDLKNHTEIAEIKAFINLLRKMLALNPADRIHPKNALKHKFIKMGHLPGSSSDTQQRKPTESHITDQDNVTEVETHKSVLYPTESQDDKESSTLKLEKEVKIINQSDVYQIEEVLASREYIQLVQCRKEGTDEKVAIKVFRKENRLQAMMEVNAQDNLTDVDSEKSNVMRLIDCFIYKDTVCLVYELSHHVSVSNLLAKQDQT
nr:uncharacterized protein LOC107381486 [Nothobranchius furzeri]